MRSFVRTGVRREGSPGRGKSGRNGRGRSPGDGKKCKQFMREMRGFGEIFRVVKRLNPFGKGVPGGSYRATDDSWRTAQRERRFLDILDQSRWISRFQRVQCVTGIHCGLSRENTVSCAGCGWAVKWHSAGTQPCEAGTQPCEAGTQPCEAERQPCEAGTVAGSPARRIGQTDRPDG
jgi:hypothetical protein